MSLYVQYDQLAKHDFSGEEIVIHSEFVFFWKPPNTFGQWTQSTFCVADDIYDCAEQFMMAEKARLFGDSEVRNQILSTHSPKEQKRLGREVRGFQQTVWEEHREGIVFRGNLAKFQQHAGSRAELLQTGNRTLVEASPYDRIWGIGLRADDPRAIDPGAWRGLNLLGKTLMRVRDALAERAGS